LSTRPAIVGRCVLFVLLAGWMNAGPLVKQVLRVKAPLMQQWVMFSGVSLDTCTVRYAEHTAEGGDEPLDRYEVLGVERGWDAPKSVRLVRTVEQARSIGQKMCRKLGPDADVRAFVRCATRTGWKRELKGDENLCERKK
jgi:hypothetical protein